MHQFEFIIWLLPIMFMIHDFEEMISMQSWIESEQDYLSHKFPSLARKIVPMMNSLGTKGFMVAVFEEFLLVSVITVIAIRYHYYYLWLAAFMAFSLHLVTHLLQWLMIRKYIPAIITTILIIPYCVYGFMKILYNPYFTSSGIIKWSIIGVLLMLVNLFFAHWLGRAFVRKYHFSDN